jgi:hypothetical protein
MTTASVVKIFHIKGDDDMYAEYNSRGEIETVRNGGGGSPYFLGLWFKRLNLTVFRIERFRDHDWLIWCEEELGDHS